MPIISRVFHNRLQKNIKLESDPTVLYFMNDVDLQLFKLDPSNKEAVKIFRKYKKIDNPYNSYYHTGLPPSPINNPGKFAMESAIAPIDTNKVLLYFVADGTGGHVFSETLRQHRLAIRKIRNGY